jgi:hypothetical protein
MRGIAGLCGLAVTLALCLTWELTAPEPAPDTSASRMVASSPSLSRTTMTKPGTEPYEGKALIDVAASITERPLFNPTRRPPAGPAPVATGTAPGDVLPRLTGVIVGPGGGRAIFAGIDGKPRTAAEGDTVGEFKIRSIGPGLVTLSGPEGPRVMRPTYVAMPRGATPEVSENDGARSAAQVPSGTR